MSGSHYGTRANTTRAVERRSPSPPHANPADEIAALRARIEGLQLQLEGLQPLDFNDAFLAPPPIPNPILVAPPVGRVDVKVPRPRDFDGNRAAFDGFRAQVDLFFQLQPNAYPPVIHIQAIGTFLVGPALAWFAATTRADPGILDDPRGFWNAFENAFGDPHKAATAMRGIETLRQGDRAVADYAADFRQLVVHLDWSDAPLIRAFKRGLSSAVGNLLVTFPEQLTLTQVINDATTCGHRLAELSALQAPPARPTQHRPWAPPGAAPAPAAPAQAAVRGPLSDQEKQRRRDLGLCLYCGQPGHRAAGCPAKVARPLVPGNAPAQQ